ncbi:MAG: Transposase, Mutator family [Syntrophorhabdus sp. PtaU1.Bin002]|nr:MAG: Transposase, Mutator family [Syntrophorhabdus sp. PtaU1.Bin002]
MKNNEPVVRENQDAETTKSPLEEIIREGARKLLQMAVEQEVSAYIEMFKELKDEDGRRLVVRHGFLPERSLLTGIGPVPVKQPRVRDKREGESFTSAILPRYLRRVPSLDNLIPTLYLKGISTGDFTRALEAILGENAKGLSASTIIRLKKQWEQDYKEWARRDLSGTRYVYFWADGIYFNVRLEDTENKRQCFLIIIGACLDGTKELVAVLDGYRESRLSWMELLSSLKERGLSEGPKLAVGDGGLGFWAALREIYPGTKEQRCWVHKTANILDKMPKSVQQKAKQKIHDIYLAPTKEQAIVAYNSFFSLYGKKFPEACGCLSKDKDVLFTFYDFPAEHWIHIRTTNPIESTFATVRLRTNKTKGCGTRLATLCMVFKLTHETQKTWKKIKGYRMIPDVLRGTVFIDGELPDVAEQVA